MAGFIFITTMENSKDYITELMKYCDPHSLLVIGIEGQLIRLYCPFTVVPILSIGELIKGDVYLVVAVKVTLELEDVYIIEGKAYFIMHFRIII